MKKLIVIIALLYFGTSNAQGIEVDYVAYKKYTTAQKLALDVSDTSFTYYVYDTDNQRLEKNEGFGWVSDGGSLDLSADYHWTGKHTYFNDNIKITNQPAVEVWFGNQRTSQLYNEFEFVRDGANAVHITPSPNMTDNLYLYTPYMTANDTIALKSDIGSSVSSDLTFYKEEGQINHDFIVRIGDKETNDLQSYVEVYKDSFNFINSYAELKVIQEAAIGKPYSNVRTYRDSVIINTDNFRINGVDYVPGGNVTLSGNNDFTGENTFTSTYGTKTPLILNINSDDQSSGGGQVAEGMALLVTAEDGHAGIIAATDGGTVLRMMTTVDNANDVLFHENRSTGVSVKTFRLTRNGEVYANKFIGDGSTLSNVFTAHPNSPLKPIIWAGTNTEWEAQFGTSYTPPANWFVVNTTKAPPLLYAADITDFDTEVSNNVTVSINSGKKSFETSTSVGQTIDMSGLTQDNFSSADGSAVFTMTNITTGGYAEVLVNRTGAPTVTGATQFPNTATFIDGTDMILCVKDFNGTRKFWFVEF